MFLRGLLEIITGRESPGFVLSAESVVLPRAHRSAHIVDSDVIVAEEFEAGAHLEAEVKSAAFYLGLFQRELFIAINQVIEK